MPDLRRYRARAGTVLARERGATDQLCAGHQQFSPHRHLQDMFMAAMREGLCWHILRDDGLAQACLEQALNPNSLRTYEDLERIPDWAPQTHSPAREKRDRRRWDRVMRHSLCDLGWSKPRRRQADPCEDELRCSAGHWHLPRVVRWQANRLFTPCYSSCSQLSWTVQNELQQGCCECGRCGQWTEDKGVLALWRNC
jgi:hypothetical protein